MTARVHLETTAPVIKEAQETGDVWVEQEEYEPLFEPQRTYVSLEINLSNPVVPKSTNISEPQPNEIVATP